MHTRLTAFQTSCEDALSEVLEFHSTQLVDRKVAEDGEPFVHGQVAGADIEVWIYPDEAEYRAGKRRRNYEVAVFGDEGQTIASFVAGVARELK